MRRAGTGRDASPPLGLKWIATSAALGAAGMWLVLSRGTSPETGAPASTPAAPAVAVSPAAAPPADGTPWTVAPQAAPPTARPAAATPRAPGVRREDTALPSPELGPPVGDPADYALDDATLSRRARTQFGLDCPGIAERRARRSGRFEVICTNGLRLRVNLMGDGPPGIVPIG